MKHTKNFGKKAAEPNSDLELVRVRILRGGSYRDQSTIMLCPTRGLFPLRVVQALLSLMTPMNQKFTRIFLEKMEVGDAYNAGIEMILANPELSKWRYILTIEDDNLPPPDGLLKLLEQMHRADAVSGLYFVKGEHGTAMIYGDPVVMPKNFIPQVPIPESLQYCNGIGMGFALWKIDLFRKVPKPWFRTLQQFTPGVGIAAATQDLFFCQEAAKHGAKFAVDTRVRVGHLDSSTDTVW